MVWVKGVRAAFPKWTHLDWGEGSRASYAHKGLWVRWRSLEDQVG